MTTPKRVGVEMPTDGFVGPFAPRPTKYLNFPFPRRHSPFVLDLPRTPYLYQDSCGDELNEIPGNGGG